MRLIIKALMMKIQLYLIIIGSRTRYSYIVRHMPVQTACEELKEPCGSNLTSQYCVLSVLCSVCMSFPIKCYKSKNSVYHVLIAKLVQVALTTGGPTKTGRIQKLVWK